MDYTIWVSGVDGSTVAIPGHMITCINRPSGSTHTIIGLQGGGAIASNTPMGTVVDRYNEFMRNVTTKK